MEAKKQTDEGTDVIKFTKNATFSWFFAVSLNGSLRFGFFQRLKKILSKKSVNFGKNNPILPSMRQRRVYLHCKFGDKQHEYWRCFFVWALSMFGRSAAVERWFVSEEDSKTGFWVEVGVVRNIFPDDFCYLEKQCAKYKCIEIALIYQYPASRLHRPAHRVIHQTLSLPIFFFQNIDDDLMLVL